MHEFFFEGLLHLASMAVLVTAGYLGIDRLQPERPLFVADLDRVRDRVKKMLDELSQRKDKPTLIDLPDQLCFQAVYFLCYVGEVPFKYKSRWHSGWAVVYRIWYAPLLGYFRHKHDRTAVAALFIILLFGFLLLTIIPVFHTELSATLLHWRNASGWIPASEQFWMFLLWAYFSAALVWVMVTVGVALLWLRRLNETCLSRAEVGRKKVEKAMAYDFSSARDTFRRYATENERDPDAT